MNYLIKGNNINVFKKIKQKNMKFDLILTDPPYNVSRKHQLGFSNMGRSGMDYGDWDYKFNQIKWLDNIAELLNPNGSIIIFNDWKNMGDISKKLEMEGFIIKDLIRWEKSNPMPRNVSRRYVTDYEFAIWATLKKAKWTFNKPNTKPYLKPSFHHPIQSKSKDKIHPTQKPLKLIENIIKIHSNKGDYILDPFSGSGSTGVAAKNLKRNFVLIEKNKEFYEKSKEKFDKITTSL